MHHGCLSRYYSFEAIHSTRSQARPGERMIVWSTYWLTDCLPVYLSLCLSICLSVCLSVCFSASIFLTLSILGSRIIFNCLFVGPRLIILTSLPPPFYSLVYFLLLTYLSPLSLSLSTCFLTSHLTSLLTNLLSHLLSSLFLLFCMRLQSLIFMLPLQI